MPYKLKVPFDMSFIQQYGKVFKVYDDQDSGKNGSMVGVRLY